MKQAAALLGVAMLSALGGCQLSPPVPEAAPPELELLDSQPLVLADSCVADGSVFVEFTVRADGRADDLKLPSVPACVRDALSAWVDSFRYSPPGAETPTGLEWMLVSARKGS
jgi:hypothetical protein